MTCSYCEEEVDKITEFTTGSLCDRCVEEAKELMGSIGDAAILSNNFFCVFLNREHFRLGFGFSFTGWFELDLGFISIKSTHN